MLGIFQRALPEE